MLGILQLHQIDEVLQKELVGRIGCHDNGETYIVPISYVYDGAAIYCHTQEGKKTAMMRKNPQICFQVDEMKNMANWRSVLVQGTFEEITERDERNLAMSHLLSRYRPMVSSITMHLGKYWPFHPGDATDIEGVVFRINIKTKSGRFELSGSSPHLPG
ncbi:MAG TPA: pyridoxamine 5'-phosphate oxidase family protein [Flavisolibacter sp.]|nr:pyridoxamine 5'-phosphate oxidase family protein [Flavisolibacter sp.]